MVLITALHLLYMHMVRMGSEHTLQTNIQVDMTGSVILFAYVLKLLFRGEN